MKKSLINFYQYEFVWSYLNDFKEWFNSKYTLKFELEPFLSGEYDIVGFFLSNGLIVFIYLNINQIEKQIILDDSFLKGYITISINPNDPLNYKELEMLIFTYSSKLRLKGGLW